MQHDIVLFRDPKWYSWLKNDSIDDVAKVLVSPLILPILAFEWLARWNGERTIWLMVGAFWFLIMALLVKALFV